MFSIIDSYNVKMQIVQGRELAAKDRHFLTRQRTTSDPYVVAFLGLDKRLGQTKTIDKTVNPIWNSTFSFSVPNKKKDQTMPADITAHRQSLKEGGATNDEKGTTIMIRACGIAFLKIYDDDKLTDPDLMGTVVVPIPAPTSKIPNRESITRQWYKVDNLFVPNATGEIEVEFTIIPVLVSKLSSSDWLPSPQTVAKWTASCMGTKPAVNEHNVIVENAPDRRNYIMALVNEMYANRSGGDKKRDSELFEVPLDTRLNQDTNSLINWLGKADKSVGRGGFSKLLLATS